MMRLIGQPFVRTCVQLLFVALSLTLPAIDCSAVVLGQIENFASKVGPVPLAEVDGDYNGNGIVDAADYTVWRDTQGQNGPALPADGNGDTMVDAADFDHWQQRFSHDGGEVAQAEAEGEGLAIPEPAGVLLGIMLLLVAGLWRWFDLRAATNRS